MHLKEKDKKLLLQAALGNIKVDTVITNIQLVNVITGEIYPASVFVHDGFIVHVEYKEVNKDLDLAYEVIDGNNNYLIPGLIDAHVHIESSMLTPRNFAKASIIHGSTTVITDPHEIANVFGVEGVKYMVDASEGLPQRQLINIPSCVPSVLDLENAGAKFKPEDIKEMAKFNRVYGLAEVMDYVGVIEGENRMLDIIDVALKEGLYIQGHAPYVTDRNLSAYLIGGPTTDHESRVGLEGLEKMRSGMYVDARQSSITHNVKDIVEAVKDIRYFDHLCLCTDDRESDEILNIGQINDVVNIAIQSGLHPIDAIRAASYNIAREINAQDLGAIAPGFIADMLIVEDLENIQPTHVFFEGKLVAKDKELVVEIEDKEFEIETRNSMYTKELTLDDFIIDVKDRKDEALVNVIYFKDRKVSASDLIQEKIPIINNQLDISHDDDLKYVAVINRHHHQENIGLGIIRGFGTTKGTIASTVSHDSHNLTIVYDKPEDALVAAKELIRVGGGQTAVINGEVQATLELKVAGLMSSKPTHIVAKEAENMKVVYREFGLTELLNPLLRIVAMALIVIPKYKMSDLGIVDVLNKKVIKTFV